MNADRKTTTRLLTALVMALAAATAGCVVGAGQIVAGDAALPADEFSPAYLDRVASGSVVSENDAMRGILLLVDGKDDAEDFTQRVRTLLAKGIVSDEWNFDAGRATTKGKLAYMIYQTCGIPGGVTLSLFGPSQRYCLMELQYRGILSSGVFYSKVTGLEFVAALTRADTYLQTGEVPQIMSSVGE